MPAERTDFADLARRLVSIAAVRRHDPEEALKMDVDPLLREALEREGIAVAPQYETRTLFGGRQDAVYGQLVLEYERPGTLGTPQGLEHTVSQLQGYLEATARQRVQRGEAAGTALRRLAGAGLDGERVVIVRYWPSPGPQERARTRPLSSFSPAEASGGFQVLGPRPVAEDSLRELFTYFRALVRLPLQADRLAEAFGPRTDVACHVIGALYQSLSAARQASSDTFRRQWEYTFGVVFGEETGRAAEDVAELAGAYGLPTDAALQPALFAVHTYFALLMKVLVAELLSLQPGSMAPAFVAELAAADDEALHRALSDLERGGFFARYGVANFLEGDYFRWYLEAWTPELASAIRGVSSALSRFEPATPQLSPEPTRDLLKRLYQYLVPRKLRHDLGEYYTPDWLAERLLNQLPYDGDPSKRLLDPACGSGTFLTLAISRARSHLERRFQDRTPDEMRAYANQILRNIVGFDLNPLAVIASRTNYLLAMGDLWRWVHQPAEIPVYLCDSVLTPMRQGTAQGAAEQDLFATAPGARPFVLPTSVGTFSIPEAVVTGAHLPVVTRLLEECSHLRVGEDVFLERIGRDCAHFEPPVQLLLRELYRAIQRLEGEGRNGIWARLLRNNFAPVLQIQQGRFDYVVGNPPWVNWESLPAEWRDASKPLWGRYGLFTLKGHAARLGGGKKDLSMLFVYVAADAYVKQGGRIGFVITRTLLKTKGAGDGFRRFQLGDRPVYLRVVAVDDLTELQPFENATNQTAIMILQVGEQRTTYPVSYNVWSKRGAAKGPIGQGLALSEVQALVTYRQSKARPVAVADATSPWLTGHGLLLDALQKVAGKSPYRAHAGSCGWLNGAYWVRVLDRRPDGLVVVENLYAVGKIKLPQVQAVVEPDLLYPLIRGRDVRRWVATPSAHLILAQDPATRAGWPERRMQLEWPRTYAYLKEFEEQLRRRAGFRQYFDPARDPFWSMYNVGPYTLAPFKVVWRETADRLVVGSAGPVEGRRAAVPDHTVVLVPVGGAEEMHYLAAMLNSSPVRAFVEGYVALHPSPHVLGFLNIPAFDAENQEHVALAHLSTLAAEAGGVGSAALTAEAQIDERAARLWGMSARDLRAIRAAVR